MKIHSQEAQLPAEHDTLFVAAGLNEVLWPDLEDFASAAEDAVVCHIDGAVSTERNATGREESFTGYFCPGAIFRATNQTAAPIPISKRGQQTIPGDLQNVQGTVRTEGNIDDCRKAAGKDLRCSAPGRHAVNIRVTGASFLCCLGFKDSVAVSFKAVMGSRGCLLPASISSVFSTSTIPRSRSGQEKPVWALRS